MNKIYQNTLDVPQKLFTKRFNGLYKVPVNSHGSRVGFTLIELLVVVLIIGILAAVALPKYQRAVEKARAAEGLVLLRAVRDASQRYYMANGVYSRDIRQLDLKFTGVDGSYGSVPRRKTKWFSLATRGTEMAIANRIPEDTQYVFLASPTKMWCRGHNEIGKKICQSLGREKVQDGGYESWKID